MDTQARARRRNAGPGGRRGTAYARLAALAWALLAAAPATAAAASAGTHIFFSAGCADCWPYTEQVLIPTLEAEGLAADPAIHDYTAPGGRRLLLDHADAIELPRSIAD